MTGPPAATWRQARDIVDALAYADLEDKAGLYAELG
jgi:hypothetical protein